MFKNERYLTAGIALTLPPWLVFMLWDLIDEMKTPVDYLQVFSVSCEEKDGLSHLTIVHSQENPEYSQTYTAVTQDKVTAKIFVIDDGDHSTMLLAEEY